MLGWDGLEEEPMRATLLRLSTAATTFAIACEGSDPEDTGTKTYADERVDSGLLDTGVVPTETPDGYFRVKYLMFEGNFGYSETAGIVNPMSPQGELQSAIIIRLGKEEWEDDGFAASSDHACEIYLPLVGGPDPFWATAPLYYGVDYDETIPAATSCTPDDSAELDPNVWGPPPGFAFTRYYSWGIGVGPIDPAYEVEYIGGPYEGFIGGGHVENAFLPPPGGTDGYVAIANQMDQDHELLINKDNTPVLIPEADWPTIAQPSPLPQAEYTIFSRLIWSFEEPL